jgi:hypothetical protein
LLTAISFALQLTCKRVATKERIRQRQRGAATVEGLTQMFMTNRTQRFATRGNGAAIIRARGNEPLELEAIRRHVPSVFAEQAHESRSERFVANPTSNILNGLMAQGFQPFEARQGGSRVAGKKEFTKHMLRLRHPDQGQGLQALGGLMPEIILINGNDGTSSYQLMSGVFRMVCTNGLICGDVFDMERVRHTGRADQVIDNVIDASFRVVSETPRVMDGARQMGSIQLSAPEQEAFATAALQLRWDDPEAAPPIEARQLLRAHRAADTGRDLWSTMNVAQENLLGGGQRYRTQPTQASPRGQFRRVGEVNGIDQNKGINRALWTLAAEMQRLKAA